jgi:hypothetical protein
VDGCASTTPEQLARPKPTTEKQMKTSNLLRGRIMLFFQKIEDTEQHLPLRFAASILTISDHHFSSSTIRRVSILILARI